MSPAAKLARTFAYATGQYVGRVGGWVYRTDTGRPVCQGWAALADILERRRVIVAGRIDWARQRRVR